MPERHAWIDASAGVAGDMLLGALVDAGAELDFVRVCVEAVIPGSVEIVASSVTRAGLRATKIDIEMLVDDPPHRTWLTIRDLISAAALPARVRERALAVFEGLAGAEARVHGVTPEEIHFHEVGALDSIGDVVGVCAALESLRVDRLSAGEVALGSGRARMAHGEIPVPVPAVVELSRGWRVRAGGVGELTTPTGMALLAALCAECTDLPTMTVERVGVGAGTKETAGRPNVTRVLVGETAGGTATDPADRTEAAVLLEANVDDQDPRLWPGVLARLLAAGAADAWLVPILMKKGRPAYTLSVLCRPEQVRALRGEIFASTTTIGVRQHQLRRYALPRVWVDIPLPGGSIAVKIAYEGGRIVRVTPEFEAVAAYAAEHAQSEQMVMLAAVRAATDLGYLVGAPWPPPAAG
jgi:pyridinium-3,5-bisthiocarboxylic acid mononucleotide nickel chelatase